MNCLEESIVSGFWTKLSCRKVWLSWSRIIFESVYERRIRNITMLVSEDIEDGRESKEGRNGKRKQDTYFPSWFLIYIDWILNRIVEEDFRRRMRSSTPLYIVSGVSGRQKTVKLQIARDIRVVQERTWWNVAVLSIEQFWSCRAAWCPFLCWV